MSGKKQPKNPLKAVLAGGIAGGIEICCTYPTEFVKTQLQLDERSKNPRYTGIADVVRQTVQQKGIVGLYKGIAPLLWGSVPKSAVRFGAYEFYKGRLMDDNGKLTQGRTLLAGLMAGMTEAVFAETVKVKFIHDQNQPNPKYKSFLHGLGEIRRTEGWGGLYKGLVPTVLKQGTNQAMRFFVYNNTTDWIKEKTGSKTLNPIYSLFAGGLAGFVSVYGNTPIDVVKTRMQGLDAHKYKSAWDCVRSIWVNEGPRAFYKGTVPRLGRVVLDTAITFALYEKLVELLDMVLGKD